MAGWCEKHLYPHQIRYLTIYEDEHSFSNDDIHATIYYRGARHDQLSLPVDIQSPIYSYETHVQGGNWSESYEWSANRMTELGVKETHCCPATANKETGNKKVVGLLYWSNTVEEALNNRGGGCCAVF